MYCIIPVFLSFQKECRCPVLGVLIQDLTELRAQTEANYTILKITPCHRETLVAEQNILCQL